MTERRGSPSKSSSGPGPLTGGQALDALVGEAKDHLDVRKPGTPKKKDMLADVDWSRLEARVMTSIAEDEDEKPPFLRDREHTRRASRREIALRAGAVVLAAAAVVTLFVRRDRDSAHGGLSSPASASFGSASSLRATEGAGEVRVGGIVATPGYVLRNGDAVDVDGARAVFERSRKVAWLLEQDGNSQDAPNTTLPGPVARARVKAAGDPLVLGLESGVIEAQVVPVASGEAFAVDIATARSLVRVAVHGTHLRVARAGNHVVVDLTEGVVSIGVPPRMGVTHGRIITAPAHVELDATDLATLRVDHSPAAVRAAIPLGYHEVASATPRSETASPPPELREHEPVAASVGAKAAVATSDSEPAPKAVSPKTSPSARERISAAVRECATGISRSGEVQVTVSSKLHLRVSASGDVESAQFSPPLLPEVQACAARVIYKTKLEETGLVTVPIEFSY